MGKVKKKKASPNISAKEKSGNCLTSHSMHGIETKHRSYLVEKAKLVFKDYSKSPCLSKTATDESCLGISSFHHFKLPQHLGIPSGSIFVGLQAISKDENVSLSVEKKLNIPDEVASTPPYPNILRHCRSDLRKPKLFSSPMKSLTFSPSKFFNTSDSPACEKNDLDNSRNISMLGCVSDVDDSGISILDTTLADDDEVVPLSSTPSFQSCRKSSPQNVLLQSFSFDSSFDTSESNEYGKSFKEIPQLEAFLHTSAPQTPTPIKFPCGVNSSMTEETISFQTTASTSGNDDCNLLSDIEDCKISSLSQIVAANSATANQSCRFRRSLFDANNNCKKKKKLIKIEYRSSVNGKKLFLRKHKATPNGMFVRKPSIRAKRERTTSLTDQWVSVACGRSYDQKLMTAAAKKCMETELKLTSNCK